MTDAKRIADIKGGHVLEQGVPLSRSRLWDIQRSFYEKQGLRAWGDGHVPSGITSNPVIASGYAEVILAFLRDCDAAGHLDRSQPVHVLELGSGSGRLGFNLVRRLKELLAATTLRDQPVTVVLSDFDRAKLEQLAGHPRLQADLASGWLDFAVVDLAVPGEIRTIRRKEVVADAPLVVVANYVFDTLPADLYAVREGKVHEVGLTLTADTATLEPDDPEALSRLRLSWDTAEAPAAPLGEPELDSVLTRYSELLGSTNVILPTAAIACLDRLTAITREPTLVLVADKGWAHLRDLAGQGPPAVVPHGGSFSMMVNFDALARVVRGRGGTVLLPPHQPQQLVVGAFVLGGFEAPETARRYADILAEGGPDDRRSIHAGTVPTKGQLTLQHALSMLRTDRWDSHTFIELYPALHELAAAAAPRAQADVALAVQRVWEWWFPIGELPDIPLYLGVLLSRMGRHREALPMFAASHELRGATPETHYAAALARHGLRELDEALKEVRAALDLNPVFEPARALAVDLEAELGRDTGGTLPAAISGQGVPPS